MSAFNGIGRLRALFTHTIRNTWIDLHYGHLLLGMRRSRYTHLGARSSSNSDYEVLEYIFKGRIKPDDILVDVGCGKGRVLNCWLHMGFRNRIYGLEYETDLVAQIQQRLGRYPNVKVIAGDALANLPPDATLFYLFNPFTEPVTVAFKQRLVEVYGARGNITVLYYNCVFLHVFQNDPRWEIEKIEMPQPRGYMYQPLSVIRMRSPV